MAAKTAKPTSTAKTVGGNVGGQNAGTASLQFSLPQMLDLALGTPEVGTVNLNILHNFLHVLLHQVNLRTTKVEYRGEDAARLQVSISDEEESPSDFNPVLAFLCPQNVVTNARTGPSLHLHEYNIIESSGRVKQRIHSTEDVTVKVDVYTEESKTPGTKGTKSAKSAASAPASARGKGVKEQGFDLYEKGAVRQYSNIRKLFENAHDFYYPGKKHLYSIIVSASEASLESRPSVVGNGAKKTKGMKQQVGGGSQSEAHSVIFVEPVVDGAMPTALGFKQLEDTIHKLQADFRALEELATTPEMIERLKTNSTDPVTDMWHVINITKRLDAAEQGIDKITTMVQDLIKSDKVITLGGNGGGNTGVNAAGSEGGNENVAPQLLDIDKRLTDLENQLSVSGSSNTVEKPAHPTTSVDGDVSSEITTLKTEMAQLRKDLLDLIGKIGNADLTPAAKKGASVVESGLEGKNAGEIVTKSEPGVSDAGTTLEGNSKILEQIQNMEVMFGNATQDLVQRVQDLEKDVGCLIEKANSAPMAGVTSDGSQNLGDLINKIQTIQSDMESINQTANRLLDDKETRETHTNALLEQIEFLKIIKADKEDLEGALANKADARAVNRKVSYDQFDAACDDLARGLEEAVTKLTQQEGIWQKALDEVQQEIEGKLDKIEISPLKEFVNNKLKTLQEKLKTLSDLKHESEAAGTKKLLRDVQCLSCDKNVVMKMQEGAVFHAEPMPCTRSMKPYLTYELDQVRKQQRRLPHGRNMIQFEAAMQEEARKVRPPREDSLAKSPRDHLCNRYCGGSHTVTTPQQRVMRMGHFLTQWGPEAIQLTEGVIRGTDGQMYRSRALPSTPEVCVPQEAGDQKQPEEVMPAPTPPPPPQEPRSTSVSSSRLGEVIIEESGSAEGKEDASEEGGDENDEEDATEAVHEGEHEEQHEEVAPVLEEPPAVVNAVDEVAAESQTATSEEEGAE
ncbi:uncharacterized protein LOC124293023 [Neodiprion lecontei]|uniref:Uncharacterized protein LOC124293023 n=1 Tax=Neodiprion lecontei TaxID=441921 RepID=A0ABM3FIN7_NEOLC|nr:uncharacterized protein LOC124293023 [Neodiprion lecontei]